MREVVSAHPSAMATDDAERALEQGFVWAVADVGAGSAQQRLLAVLGELGCPIEMDSGAGRGGRIVGDGAIRAMRRTCSRKRGRGDLFRRWRAAVRAGRRRALGRRVRRLA